VLVATLSVPRLELGDSRQLPRALPRAGRQPQLQGRLFSRRRAGSIVEPAMAARRRGRRTRGAAVAVAGQLSNTALKADGHAPCLRKGRARGLRQRSTGT
jgi:hypothetical protein